MAEAIALHTSDGLTLEGEWAAPPNAVATVVLCHPHPAYGGTMRSIVTSQLFDALPGLDIAALRFNFRGVEGSEGEYSEGRDEPLDVGAAVDAAASHGVGPILLCGFSFGADMALSVHDARLAAWIAIAPPLRFRASADYDAVANDARPKLLVLAAHDEFRSPADIEEATRVWVNTRTETVAGASHFFVGRTDRVVDLAAGFVREVAG